MSVSYGSGWRPGLLGWCTARHGEYYAEHWSFGAYFECKVAREMAEFITRLDHPGNHLFWAADRDGILATLSLDGGDGEDGLSHLRWFIAGDRARGRGTGQHLMRQAVDAARADGAAGIFLWTFAGLSAARRVYDKAGFAMTVEREDTTWGVSVLEQRFELHFQGA